MRRLPLHIVLLLAALAGSVCGAGDAPLAPVAESGSDDRGHRLVFFAPRRPVLFELQIQVDGAPLQTARAEYVARLLKRADADGDGTLEADELAVHGQVVGAEGADLAGPTAAEEFSEAVLRGLGAAVELTESAPRPAQEADLFAKLDRDGDRHISAEEFAGARMSLHKLDLDDDETYSLEELGPFRDPLRPVEDSRPGPEQAGDIPFLILTSESLEPAVGEVRRRYGSTDGWHGDASALAAIDTDLDGRASDSELQEWLQRAAPQGTLIVQLPHRKPLRPKVNPSAADTPAAFPVEQARSSELTLCVDGVPVEVRAVVPPTTAYDAQQFYRLRFRTADADKNQYLDAGEFAAVMLAGAVFADLDADGDEMVFEKELVEYVRRQFERTGNRVVVEVSREGRTLFEILDENGDRRLSPRELRTGVGRIAELDRDGNGLLAEGEIAESYKLTFRIDSGGLLDVEPAAATMDAAVQPVRFGATAGPEWFRRMDRNADGDLTPREFVGPLEDFPKLDRDSDGLIDAEEAARADAAGSGGD